MESSAFHSLVDKRRESDLTQAFHYTYVSAARKFVWVANMKVASTTTGTALSELEGIDLGGRNFWASDELERLENLSTDQIAKILSSADWFKFTFVRNPYTRLFSAWKSKIGNRNAEPFYQTAQDEIRLRLGYEDKNATVTFSDFVHYIHAGARPGDSHWCVQNTRLMQDLVAYDFIGRYEQFASDITHVLKRLNAPAEVHASAAEVRGKSNSVSHITAYDQELADMAWEIYRDDFEAFNYPRNSWMGNA